MPRPELRRRTMDEADAALHRAALERVGPRSLTGYCYDPHRPTTRVVVELQIDGVAVAWAQADAFVDGLARAGIGDGFHGFAFYLTPEIIAGGGRAQLAVANLGLTPAPPVDLTAAAFETERDAGAGRVRWIGGLQLTGWLSASVERLAPEVRVSLDGHLIARTPADRWHHVQEVGGARPVPAFDLHLPASLADGAVKRLVVTDGMGIPLRGSPLTLVAFPDPLLEAIQARYGAEHEATRARARLFDTLLPKSWPLSDPEGWLAAHPTPRPEDPQPMVAVAIVGEEEGAVTRTLKSLDQQSGLTWVAAALPSADCVGFHADDLAAFLEADGRDCATVLAVPAGAEFLAGGAARLTEALTRAPTARLAHGDITLCDATQETVLAFPSFDYERWLEQGYGALAFAVPMREAREALRSGADSLYRFANSQFDRRAVDAAERSDGVLHLPGVVARIPFLDLGAATNHLVSATRRHLAMRRVSAAVRPGRGTLMPAARVVRSPPPGRVSVIIPIRDRAELLQRCLTSIEPALDSCAAELIIVDNGSTDPATHALLRSVQGRGGRVIAEPGPFNYARLCNRAFAEARGEFVLFLNNDVELRGEGWLDELLGRLGEASTDAVGAVLRWPSGVIQHGGIVLGPGFSASHAFDDRFQGDSGYGDLLRVANEPSAVTGACLLVRRAAYAAVGGMDEAHFPINFNDVDLCLKLLARGGRVVMTPHLDAIHVGSASRGSDRRPDQKHRYQRELEALRARWGDVLHADPAYSPLLALSDNPYTALACPPRELLPRLRRVPTARSIPIGL